MSLSLRQDSTYIRNGRWKWGVWLEGDSEELDQVDHVMYVLDRTFLDPVREVDTRATKFRLETSTWGAFTMHAKAVFKDGREIHFQHDVVLASPENIPAPA